jgi:hypothetical protein
VGCKVHCSFEGIYCFRLQGLRVSQTNQQEVCRPSFLLPIPIFFFFCLYFAPSLKIEAKYSSKTMGSVRTIRRYNLDDVFLFVFLISVILCVLHLVCIPVDHPLPHQLLNTLTILYGTWYVYHDNLTHLNGVLYKSLPSVRVSVCVSLLSLLSNGSVNRFPLQRIDAAVEELLDASFSVWSVPYQRGFCGSVCVFPYRF